MYRRTCTHTYTTHAYLHHARCILTYINTNITLLIFQKPKQKGIHILYLPEFVRQPAVHSTTLHPLPAKKKHFNYNTPTDIIYYLRTIITSHYPNLHISYIYLILTYISSCLYVILPVHYLIYMLSYLYVILPVRFLSFTISYLYVILPLHYLTCHFQFSEISR